MEERGDTLLSTGENMKSKWRKRKFGGKLKIEKHPVENQLEGGQGKNKNRGKTYWTEFITFFHELIFPKHRGQEGDKE